MVNFNVDDTLINKFKIAAELNGADENEVVSKLLSEYVAETFENEARTVLENTSPSARLSYLDPGNAKYAKAKRKIPTWSRKKNQINHKIIKAFFQLEREQEVVTVSTLEQRCRDQQNHQETFVNDFKGNFTQLKTDAGNSHGKVFIVDENDIVTIWDEIKDVLMEYKNFFN